MSLSFVEFAARRGGERESGCGPQALQGESFLKEFYKFEPVGKGEPEDNTRSNISSGDALPARRVFRLDNIQY